MAKKEKKQPISIEQEQVIQIEKIQEIEQKIQEILANLSLMPSNDILNEININYQNIKNQLEDQVQKINDINRNIENLSLNITDIEKTLLDMNKYKEDLSLKYEELKKLDFYINEIIEKLEFVETLKNEYPIIKEKYPLIDHLISQISLLENYYLEIKSLEDRIKENILNLERELNILKEQIESKIEQKITEFFENYQHRVDEAQTEKINKLEEKFNNIIKEVEIKTQEKITEYVVNVQSQIDSAQTQKIIELEERINNILKSHFSESEKNIELLKEKLISYINEILLEKVNLIINNYRDSLLPEIDKKIDSLTEFFKTENQQTSENLKNDINFYISELHEKISTLEQHIFSQINNINTNQIQKINELEEKINTYKETLNSEFLKKYSNIESLYSSLEENLNVSVEKVFSFINNLQEKYNEITQKIEKLEEKYKDFVNLIDNVSNNIINKLLKIEQKEIKLAYTDNLPYDLNKLVELMNREEIQGDYLIIKSGNRPLLKSAKTLAAIGKIVLKNGDVFNFISQLFDNEEIEQLKTTGNIEKIKNIQNYKYNVVAKIIFDDYTLILRKIPYVVEDISTLSLINPDKLLSQLSNLTLFLGVNNLKPKALSILINYINNKQIKRIALIEEKLRFLYKEQQSIIDIFEYGGDLEKLQQAIRKANNEDYDIIVISCPTLDIQTLKIILNYSSYRTFILNTEHKSVISFYNDYKEIGEDILKYLKIYIVHNIIKGSLHVPEVIFVDNKLKELIKSGDQKGIKEYILSLEESDSQTITESIGYLVKTGKITVEEAKKYLANLEELEQPKSQEQEIQI